jgi:hypothetical protein
MMDDAYRSYREGLAESYPELGHGSTLTTRKPTMVAKCGCPYDPVYDEDSLGWHLPENHIGETINSLRRDVIHLQETLAVLELSLLKTTTAERLRLVDDE